jgi:mRNA interferase MazF
MRRGEVVVVDWIFSDRTGSKLRPAVVVQADFLNGLIADTVLVAVTRKSRSASTEVVLDPAVETNSGLSHRSIASCNNFLTLDQRLVHRRLGELSVIALRQIEACLKVALALP